jgi:hypothetical protein
LSPELSAVATHDFRAWIGRFVALVVLVVLVDVEMEVDVR